MNRLLGSLVLASSIALLGGCVTVGPDYQGPPEVALPEAWNHQFDAQQTTSQDLSQWWQHLNDPLLSSLIQRATSDSLDLRLAVARVAEARGTLGVASSQKLPTIDLNGGARREKTSLKSSPFPLPTEDGHSLSLGLGWEIDLFGRIRRQSQAASANLDASVEHYRDVQVVLYAEIANHYIAVRTLQRRLALANNNVANQRESVRVVKARYRAELTSELDVNQAEQNLAGSLSAIPLLEAGLAKTKNRLATLLGLPPGSLNQELAVHQPIPQLPQQLLVTMPREVLRQRPDIRRAERQLAAQTANVGVAVADLYPRLSLLGNFGYSTLTGSLFSEPANFWAFGPNLSWNIFDNRRRRSNIAIADARTEQARAGYEKTVLGAMEDVQASLINYSREKQRLSYLMDSTEAAKKTVTIAKSQYRNGLTNFQTVLDAERVLFAEEDRLASSNGDLATYAVSIYRAMGGGWGASTEISTDSSHNTTEETGE